MKQVEVIIDLPSIRFNHSYSYSVPADFESVIEPGKRVLVDLGKNRVEGYICSQLEDDAAAELKPIIKVLDPVPVVDIKQIRLARWMSEVYLCPISVALNIMIPGLVERGVKKTLLPGISREEYQQLQPADKSETYMPLLNQLWQQGEVSAAKSLKLASATVLNEMGKKGLIVNSKVYTPPRPSRKDCCYILNPAWDYEKIINMLGKRSSRQLQVVELLHRQNHIDCNSLEHTVSAQSIKALLNKNILVIVPKPERTTVRPYSLSDEQVMALNTIIQKVRLHQYAEILLYGITGSGKTEVYLSAAEAVISQGRQAIVMVPEIALTRHLVAFFAERIARMAVVHSGMAEGERLRQWRQIKNNQVDLVLGTRSAVFAPLQNIGLIVLDEEQENTYKQEETPRYHAREVAAYRAKEDGAVLLLGSATPSLETFYRAVNGQMELLTLSHRVRDAVMPNVTVVDLKDTGMGSHGIVSPVLQHKIEASLANGQQTILFLNRRGYAPITICMECGAVSLCPHCSVALNFHRDLNRNVCHYCNYQRKETESCLVCGSRHLRQTGTGTQKVEEEIRRLFPQAVVMRLDLDSSRKRGSQEETLQRMRDKKVDILVGTQMVAKGLDFPGVSLVGIVNADGMLNIPDFRAGERCFQLIVQAAGRAGRGNIPGEVVIQTYNPDNPIIKLAARQDYFAFYKSEIKIRKMLHYPPYTNILRVVVSSADESRAQAGCREICGLTREITDAKEDYFEILGPAACSLAKIRNRYRYQIIVKCDNLLLITSVAKYIIYKDVAPHTRVEVEINPLMLI